MQHPNDDLLALTIQQPWAELILQGIKTIEVRSLKSRPRLIYLYTSRKHSSSSAAQVAIEEHGIEIDSLPTGHVVGTVEIVECRKSLPADSVAACVPEAALADRQAWVLANPKRCKPMPAKFIPYGMWFYPFKRKS